MIAYAFLLTVIAASVQERPADIDAAALVNQVRESERWIHEIDSLYARFEGGWTRSAESIARRRLELTKQYPNITEEQLQQFTDVQPEINETLVIAFDNTRVYKFSDWMGTRLETTFWDGSHVLGIYGDPEKPDRYSFNKDIGQGIGRFFLTDLSWLRGASHTFWWENKGVPGIGDGHWGPPEHFEVVGRREYRGIDCHVVEGQAGFVTWFVGVETGLLHGYIQRVLLPQNDAIEVLKAQAEDRNHAWVSTQEFYRWRSALPREDIEQMNLEYHLALVDQTRPQVEHFLIDYRDLGDGRLFPYRQGYHFFNEEPNEAGEFEVDSERQLHAVEVKVNEPLPDELFEYELKDGVEVSDHRYDVGITYTYHADIPQEEIEGLLAERRARLQEFEAEKDSRDELIGQPAFAFPDGATWLNGDPFTWDDLKGKVVILDFFADWCGPCRRDYPTLAEMHKNRRHNQLTIIGIHTPGSELDSIKTMLKQYEMAYPVIIDTAPPENARAWGLLYSQYRILSIPYAVVVGKDGRIAGHGSLHEVHAIANNLVHAEDG